MKDYKATCFFKICGIDVANPDIYLGDLLEFNTVYTNYINLVYDPDLFEVFLSSLFEDFLSSIKKDRPEKSEEFVVIFPNNHRVAMEPYKIEDNEVFFKKEVVLRFPNAQKYFKEKMEMP